MPPPIKRVSDWKSEDFSMIIDVRSNSEYADDHIPGAVNMPVLDDIERTQIGTMYKQIGAFEAKRRGAVLVTRNISQHLESKLSDAPKNFAPLIYCWRGGQRSGAMARIFSEIGWNVTVVEGGYKTYRKHVLNGLDLIPRKLRLIALRGRTGTGKTRILRSALATGAQIIDLEMLAAHRGSLLGLEPGLKQPAQRMFESRLFNILRQLDQSRPVFIEGESNKIGTCHVPATLWRVMCAAPSFQIIAPLHARVALLLSDYQHLVHEPERMEPLMQWVTTRIGHKAVARWRAAMRAADWTEFVTRVLEDHYDPAYDRSQAKCGHTNICSLKLTALDEETIANLAQRLTWQK